MTQSFKEKVQARKAQRHNVEELYRAIISSDRIALSTAITLAESTLEADKSLANQLVQRCIPHSGNSQRIGISGVPGVGKSTFIESFGLYCIQQGKKLAVLAIDPSSTQQHGSILGDKTRMNVLSNNANAFIRPSPSAGALGGVAQATREALILCEAAGFDLIFIETVGVGQSEIAVHSMVDFFLLLMLAGAGDELQGIKRGIIEIADAIVINKADGENKKPAEVAARQYASALHLFPPKESNWIAATAICSAINHWNMDKVWEILDKHFRLTVVNGHFAEQRKQQNSFWLKEALQQQLFGAFYANSAIKQHFNHIENEVLENKMSPYQGAQELMQLFTKS